MRDGGGKLGWDRTQEDAVGPANPYPSSVLRRSVSTQFMQGNLEVAGF